MQGITEDMRYREKAVQYAAERGVPAAAQKYKRSRRTIYRWRRRYDGTIESLRERSRRPHHHPRAHTAAELALIVSMRERYPEDGLVVLWVKLRRAGYRRTTTGLYRVLRRLGLLRQKPAKRKPQAYEAMRYPGERVQIDVKVVPRSCLEASAQPLYQYTALDEYSRWRYVEGFAERSEQVTAEFLEHLVQAFPCRIECVQTDNGKEFRQQRQWRGATHTTLFGVYLAKHGIRQKRIRLRTPQHNGKVERSHRKDNERFYRHKTFTDLASFRRQLKAYNREDYNDFPMAPLGWQTPNEVLFGYLAAHPEM